MIGFRFSLSFVVLLLGMVGCSRPAAAPASVSVSPTAGASTVKDGFEEIAEASGIGTFQHTDGSSGRKFFVEQMGSGVALFDYDGDGWLDIYLCSGAPLPGYKGPKPQNRLFRNRSEERRV